VRRAALALLGLALSTGAVQGATRVAPPAHGTIATVAGTGVAGWSGDGGPATAAEINHPRALAFLTDGSVVFSEPFHNTVRRIAPDGTITTVAGTGVGGYTGDGGPAAEAELNFVHGVSALPDGGFVLSDMWNDVIRRVWPDGRITTVAGNGRAGYSGDGGPATSAAINLPRGVTALRDGTLLVADSTNARVRRVSPDGIITTVAGTGVQGSSGDGGPATAAELDRPFSIAPRPDGGFLIADANANRIRLVAADGTISTVAGTGVAGYGGDGGPATAAELDQPHSVVSLPDGGFLVADAGNNRVRRVLPGGTIQTVAGTGAAGFSGDGGPATAALLSLPKALALLPGSRGFLVGDAANNRVRVVALDLRPPLQVRFDSSPLHGSRTKATRVAFTVSRKARVTLTARRGNRVVASAAATGATGAGTLTLRRLKAGRYTLRLDARSTDGKTATAKTVLRVS